MNRPDTPCPRHWLYDIVPKYGVPKYGVIIAAILVTFYLAYRVM